MLKKIIIPQENNEAVDGKQKVMYAPNKKGNFEKFKYGSSVEEYATKVAVNEYEVLKKESLLNIKAGKTSPIEYYMYLNRMDIQVLSSITGLFKFRVKRHLKAKYFSKLNEKIISKYALAFNIKPKELKEFTVE